MIFGPRRNLFTADIRSVKDVSNAQNAVELLRFSPVVSFRLGSAQPEQTLRQGWIIVQTTSQRMSRVL